MPTRNPLGRRLLLVACTALALLVGGPALVPAASAGFEPVVVAERDDEADDVKIFRRTPGLSRAKRRTIDLHHVTVQTAPRGRHRFTVRIERVAAADAEWDQMFFFRLRDPDTDDVYSLGFTQSSDDGGYAYNPATEVTCDLDTVRRRPRQKTLAVHVPARCMAPTGSRVRLTAATGHFRSDAPLWSLDRARVGRLQ